MMSRLMCLEVTASSRRNVKLCLIVTMVAWIAALWFAPPSQGADYPPISASLTGKTLAVAAVPAGSVSPTPQVFIWQYGRKPVRITHSQYSVTHPRFSPNGRLLAVNDGNQVAVIDLLTRREKVLVPGPRKFLGDWSLDGRFLCYTAFTWVPEWDDFFFPRIWYVDTRTKQTSQIPDHGADQWNPTWGPDGTIAYEEWDGVPPVIKGYNPSTDTESTLIPATGEYGEWGAENPVWTPDGDLYYSNWPPYTDDNKIFLATSAEIPGRGAPVTHNLWEWGEDTPELATAEGDLFYYSLGDSVYSTYHFLYDHFGTLWALDHIMGLEYWCGSISITRTQPLYRFWWIRSRWN